MSVEVRAIAPDDAAAVARYCDIRADVEAERAETPEGVAWEEATYPGQVVRFLAYLDSEPAGAATTGRLHIYGPDHPRYYLGIWVLPGARRRGAGTALYRAASDCARAAGKVGFRCWASEAQAEAIAFASHRGFVEEDRGKAVALDLRAFRAQNGPVLAEPPLPDGFALVTLADRPDLIPGVHRVAVEAFPSIPTAIPMEPGSLEEFTARDVYRDRIPLDGYFVAVETATGEAVGYANLIFVGSSRTVAHHDMTAVRPSFRGRGLATALKQATIAWALRAGLDELHANNDEENAPMRSINRHFGYQPLPDDIGLTGPLAPEA
ncbi:MAG TPA: GNAT family N-acetyltransferase [Candidatus Limnocylindrales bacterium]